jgi:hypothetical protein
MHKRGHKSAQRRIIMAEVLTNFLTGIGLAGIVVFATCGLMLLVHSIFNRG